MAARKRAVARRAGTGADLSHDTIRTAALALIDRDGLAAFSIRKLGAELGCEGMALYWYYRSKDALLDAIVDLMMQDVAAVLEGTRSDSWVDILRDVARAYRAVCHSHPQAFPLLATRRFSTDYTFGFLERLFALAHEHGLDDKTIAMYYRVVSSYCSGFALNELADAPTIPRKKYARLAAVATHLERKHLDEMFELGLELQLDALRTSQRPRGRHRP